MSDPLIFLSESTEKFYLNLHKLVSRLKKENFLIHQCLILFLN